MPRTHYEILGVATSVGMAEVKAAFRTLAKQLHPDVSRKEKAVAEREFKELNDAYSTLSDPNRRAQYDMILSNGGRKPFEQSVEDIQSSMSDLDIFHGTPPPQKKKKRSKNKARRRRTGVADVELDALPDGALDDDSLGGIF